MEKTLNQTSILNKVLCVNWEDAIKNVENKTIDLVLTDPPYAMAYRSNLME